MDLVLKLDRERLVLAREHSRRREALLDLLRVVRPREHEGVAPLDDLGEAATARRVEALRKDDQGRRARQGSRHLAEDTARDGDTEKLGGGNALVLGRVPARQRHLMPAVSQDTGEGRSPRARSDDGDLHPRRTKSMITGTPSRLNSSRTRFSTQ